MLEQSAQKVKPEHLSRRACLYVRQSSLHQVRHHSESTRHQYAHFIHHGIALTF